MDGEARCGLPVNPRPSCQSDAWQGMYTSRPHLSGSSLLVWRRWFDCQRSQQLCDGGSDLRGGGIVSEEVGSLHPLPPAASGTVLQCTLSCGGTWTYACLRPAQGEPLRFSEPPCFSGMRTTHNYSGPQPMAFDFGHCTLQCASPQVFYNLEACQRAETCH